MCIIYDLQGHYYLLYKEDAKKKKKKLRNFLAVWWLELYASTAGGLGSISSWGTKIPQALWCGGKTNKQTGFQRVENHCVKASCAVLSCSVMSLCNCHTPLSMGILQAIILELVAMPSSRGSSQPRDRTQISCISGGFFTVWATREALSARDCL